MPVGARLAEMARLRLRYDESRRQVQEIQQVRYVFLIKIINSKVYERKNEKISTTKISKILYCHFLFLPRSALPSHSGSWNRYLENDNDIQCDQIGQFFGLWATFQSLWQAFILPKSPTFLGNFCKGVKIFHFSSELILGNFYKHLATFYWSHWRFRRRRHETNTFKAFLIRPECRFTQSSLYRNEQIMWIDLNT